MITLNENKLFEYYHNMLHSMERSTRSTDAAELLFWFTTCDLVNQSKIEAKNDCLGIIMKHFMGVNIGSNFIVNSAENKTEEYVEFNKEYSLSDSLIELGDHWKGIFWNKRFGQILILRGWLKMYITRCMPVINHIITECEREWLQDCEITETYIKERQKAYKTYKRKLNSLLTKLEIVKEVHNLFREAPGYYD